VLMNLLYTYASLLRSLKAGCLMTGLFNCKLIQLRRPFDSLPAICAANYSPNCVIKSNFILSFNFIGSIRPFCPANDSQCTGMSLYLDLSRDSPVKLGTHKWQPVCACFLLRTLARGRCKWFVSDSRVAFIAWAGSKDGGHCGSVI